MFVKSNDLLMKEKARLYNNVAESGDCSGRLYAELQVHPSPRIAWEFESLGASACEPDTDRSQGRLKNPLVGSWFSIDEPYVSGRSLSHSGAPRVSLTGNAGYACYGDTDARFDHFVFYLPNARFHERSFVGQEYLETTTSVIGKEKNGDIGWSTGGRRLSVSIDDTWSIGLITRKDALEWLAPRRDNVGTLITTTGALYHPGDENSGPKDKSDLPTLTVVEARELLSALSVLLSFANGGYLGPLCIRGVAIERPAATILAHLTTPLELLGRSWLTTDSDITAYMHCFSALNKMLSTPPWDRAFSLILVWYFQAIQPQSTQLGKHWAVVANAIGAALERLSYTILVQELKEIDPADWGKYHKSRKRIELLLEKIGIIRKGQYRADVHFVKDFVEIRNDATHARPTLALTDDKRNEIIALAIQWIEETLLWRLGYSGQYRNRVGYHYSRTTEPRYDLSTRQAGW